MINKEIIQTEELKKNAGKVQKPKDVAAIIKQYEDIICTQKLFKKEKYYIFIAYHQRKAFKRFKEKQKFTKLVSEFKVHKGTITFKINIFKLIDMHPKLMKSSVTLHFFKNDYTDIKQIFKENLTVN